MITLDHRTDTLPKIVIANGTQMPQAIAMRRKSLGIWRRITWVDVPQQMRRIAAELLVSELAAEPCVANIGNNGPNLFWAEYAGQSTGRAAVCLYPDPSAARLAIALREVD